MRLRPWFLALIMLGACSAILGLLEWQRRTRDISDAALLARLPDKEGSSAYLNVQALRQSGLLDAIAGNRAEEEADYQAFVRFTGFDYRDDLDAVLAHFSPDFSLFLMRGRFSWEQIGTFMRAHDARCLNGVCSMRFSRGGFLSAMPLAPDIIAFGIGGHRTVVYSALQIRETRKQPPPEPFWIEFSEGFLKSGARLPEGTRAFASAVAGARSVFVSVSPNGANLEAMMRATFSTADEATTHRVLLEENTSLLQKFFDRDKQKPGQGDIGAMLVSGRFEQQQGNVIGRWPLDRNLFRRVLEGN